MVHTREQGDFCLLAGSQVNQVGVRRGKGTSLLRLASLHDFLKGRAQCLFDCTERTSAGKMCTGWRSMVGPVTSVLRFCYHRI